MRYVVTYDIEDDRTRRRVAEVLERYGERVQLSVFECALDDGQLRRLGQALERLLQEKPGGDVRLYRTCARCLEASFGLGDLEEGMGGEPWIIV